MSLAKVDKEYIGQALLKRGFSDWFRYMFQQIEGTPFIYESLHKDLLNLFDDLYNQKSIRQNINLPPRAGKTTVAKYFIVYCLIHNPKCNFIYTSYSQQLLSDIARDIQNILEHPIYKAMYPIRAKYEDIEELPVDDFWKDYLYKDTKKNTYSTRKIVTYAGGVCLFASIGAQITGFGAALRSAKNFSGGIIIDDAGKPADIHSQIMRDKVVRYYEETLLSRLNNPNALILNIQQRLHLQDLSATLLEKYHFNNLVKPLLVDGKCQLPKQYDESRLKELQANSYMFTAQYQQKPVAYGGGLFKHEWWRYYKDINTNYKRIFMTADTAMKTNEWNDYTAIGVWGLTLDNKLYLLDMVHGKFEAPDLECSFMALFEKWKLGINKKPLSKIIIEDKASGTGLIQNLRRKGGLPIRPIIPNKDKLSRVIDIIGYVSAGNVYLPENEFNMISKEFLAELDIIVSDFSHPHDDICDMMVYALNEAYQSRGLF